MTDERFRIDRETVVIDGVTSPITLMQLSDAHMSLDSELDDAENREKAKRHRDIWMGHGNGISQLENFETLTAYGREQGVDLFVYAGDMMDFPSVGTAKAATDVINAAGNFLFAPGNHEYAQTHPTLYEGVTNGTPAFQVKDLGEVVMVAVNNAAHSIPDDVLNSLKAVLYGDKPVILLHHTPVDCDTLHPAAVDYWQDVTYFLFGADGKGDNVQEYIRLVSKEKTQLKAVIAGHLHFAHVDTFENGVRQFVSAPCLAGYARIIEIKG